MSEVLLSESELGIVNSNDFLFMDSNLLLINFGKIECTGISVINIVSDIVNGSFLFVLISFVAFSSSSSESSCMLVLLSLLGQFSLFLSMSQINVYLLLFLFLFSNSTHKS